jgi:hypothetical protein
MTKQRRVLPPRPEDRLPPPTPRRAYIDASDYWLDLKGDAKAIAQEIFWQLGYHVSQTHDHDDPEILKYAHGDCDEIEAVANRLLFMVRSIRPQLPELQPEASTDGGGRDK